MTTKSLVVHVNLKKNKPCLAAPQTKIGLFLSWGAEKTTSIALELVIRPLRCFYAGFCKLLRNEQAFSNGLFIVTLGFV